MESLSYYTVNPIVLSGVMAEMYAKSGFEPVVQFSSDAGYMFAQLIIVSIIVIVSATYPIFKISYLKPVDAMRT